jgi:Rod binding domain-containing protein
MTTPTLENITAEQTATGAPRKLSKAEKRHDDLVKQTQKWVALIFYGQLMKEMRNDPFRSKLFDGGNGGQAFGEIYDQELAERMGNGTANKLVDSIVRQIEGTKTAAKAYDRQMRDAHEIQHGAKGGLYVSPDLRA